MVVFCLCTSVRREVYYVAPQPVNRQAEPRTEWEPPGTREGDLQGTLGVNTSPLAPRCSYSGAGHREALCTACCIRRHPQITAGSCAAREEGQAAENGNLTGNHWRSHCHLWLTTSSQKTSKAWSCNTHQQGRHPRGFLICWKLGGGPEQNDSTD